MAAVFSSHPDKTTIVEKIIVTNLERNVVFMRLTRIKQIENLDHQVLLSGGGSPRSGFEIEFAFAILIEHAIASRSAAAHVHPVGRHHDNGAGAEIFS